MSQAFLQYNKKTQAGASTLTVLLANKVQSGNFIVVGVISDNGADVVTSVTGMSGEAYSRTTNSPGAATPGHAWIFYKFLATGGATTVTANWSTNVGVQSMWVREFTFVGNGTFHNDAAATASGATINTPSITPTEGDIVYGVSQFGGTINNTGTPWAPLDAVSQIQNGECDEYILSSAGGATAVNFATTGSNLWHAMSASFTPEASFPTVPKNYRAFPKFLLRDPATGATSI